MEVGRYGEPLRQTELNSREMAARASAMEVGAFYDVSGLEALISE
jgi:hypothetical protein